MSRLDRLMSILPADVDGLLCTDEKNIRYFTGFNYTDGCVLITRGKSYAVTDFRYIEAAREIVFKEFEVVEQTEGVISCVNALLAAEGVKKIMLEDVTLSKSTYDKISSELKCETVPAGNIIGELREYKDKDEFEYMAKAQSIADSAFDHILGFIDPSKTEIEVALEIEFYMRSHGAEASAFDIICVSGSASSRPHGVPRDCKLERGFVTMDFGAVYNGYLSDMTRTISLGKADDDMKKMYNTVLNAQLAALDALRPGIKLAECDRIARDIIDNAGYAGCFGHGLGHGVGLDIHESPSVNKRAGDKVLHSGHVITIEPGIYVEKKYGVRIEDMVALDGETIINFAKSPKNLIEL